MLHRVRRCALALALVACGAPSPPASPWTAGFRVEAPLAGESQVCFASDATSLAGRVIQRVEWRIDSAAVATHHAVLYAVPYDLAPGAAPCELPPQDGVGLGVWLPGGDAVELPPDVGIEVPARTRAFVVQVHALRTAPGDAGTGSVAVRFWNATPPHVAAFVAAYADVPPIAPRESATADGRCTVAEPMHVVASWPHMHRAGRALAAWTEPPGAPPAPLTEADPFRFEEQRGYALDATIAAGDVVHVRCAWTNTTTMYVLPGPDTADEMCNLGLLVWPASAARWQGGGCE